MHNESRSARHGMKENVNYGKVDLYQKYSRSSPSTMLVLTPQTLFLHQVRSRKIDVNHGLDDYTEWIKKKGL